MPKTLQIKRDTLAGWTLKNPVLADGELAYEKDTGKIKIGNGSTAWTGLRYLPTTYNTPAEQSINLKSCIQVNNLYRGIYDKAGLLKWARTSGIDTHGKIKNKQHESTIYIPDGDFLQAGASNDSQFEISSNGATEIKFRLCNMNRNHLAYFNGHSYLFVHKRFSWNDAKYECESMGGHLADVKNTATLDFLHEHDFNVSVMWTGGYWNGSKWVWSDGSEIDFSAVGGCKSTSGQYTVVRDKVENEKWTCVNNWSSCPGYICEFDEIVDNKLELLDAGGLFTVSLDNGLPSVHSEILGVDLTGGNFLTGFKYEDFYYNYNGYQSMVYNGKYICKISENYKYNQRAMRAVHTYGARMWMPENMQEYNTVKNYVLGGTHHWLGGIWDGTAWRDYKGDVISYDGYDFDLLGNKDNQPYLWCSNGSFGCQNENYESFSILEMPLWREVLVRIQDGAISLYVDGALQCEAGLNVNSSIQPDYLKIGGAGDMYLDEFTFRNGAVSSFTSEYAAPVIEQEENTEEV